MSEVAEVDVPERYSHECRVASVRFLNRGTFQVELESSTGAALRYIAGHYLELNMDIDGQAHSLFYSVANRPDSKQPGRLQLFIQNGSLFTEKLLRGLVQLCGRQECLSDTANGARFTKQPETTHLLVAAGSGISKIKCLAEEIVARDPSADVRLYWSNKNIDDFYLLEEFREWEAQAKTSVLHPYSNLNIQSGTGARDLFSKSSRKINTSQIIQSLTSVGRHEWCMALLISWHRMG